MQGNSSPWPRRFGGLAVILLLCLPMNSCTAVTGLVTGPFTGLVDLPSTLVEADQDQADDPDFYAASVFLAPVGFVLGPFMGFFKGLAIDYTWVTGRVKYADVYGGYGQESVWRPFSWEWIERN